MLLISSFCCQDIYIFVSTFSSFWKSGFIRKIRLISKFLTSQPAFQTIAIHILRNISQRKGNQTMKFGKVIEHKKNIIMQKKVMQKMKQGDFFHKSFCFLKRIYMR